MKFEERIKNRINEIKQDERLTYEPATVFANAPLALIQCAEMAKLNELERLIGEKPSTLPLKQ